MLKKLFLSIAIVAAAAISVSARDTYAHSASALPQAAQTTLANNFKSKVTVVKIDKDLGRVSEYEAILSDGTEVSFDRDGNWKNVEVSAKGSVPSFFVPKAVSDYVKKTHPGQKVIGIEKSRSGYEVEISNGIDMKFDRQGQFHRYD